MTDTVLGPLGYDERRRRGFCTCPSKLDDAPPPDACLVHPDGAERPEPERTALGLVFFDDRRDRFVSWADAVEGMRQRRYAGAVNDELVQFTWVMLIRLLESLHSPLDEPAEPLTAETADALVAWAGGALDEDDRRWLMRFACGGGAFALTRMFRTIAREAAA